MKICNKCSLLPIHIFQFLFSSKYLFIYDKFNGVIKTSCSNLHQKFKTFKIARYTNNEHVIRSMT